LPSNRPWVQHGSVMGVTVGVDPVDDHPAVVRHAEVAFPLDDRAGQARIGRAGGHTSDGAWLRRLVSGHTSPSGRVHPRVVLRDGPTAPPDDTKVRSVPGQTRRQDQVHGQDPSNLDWSGHPRLAAGKDSYQDLGDSPRAGQLDGSDTAPSPPSSPQASRSVGWDGRLVCGMPSGWRCTLPAHLRPPASQALAYRRRPQVPTG
jgi:hypothetical protein